MAAEKQKNHTFVIAKIRSYILPIVNILLRKKRVSAKNVFHMLSPSIRNGMNYHMHTATILHSPKYDAALKTDLTFACLRIRRESKLHVQLCIEMNNQ